MSEFGLDTWHIAERSMQQNVQQAHREADRNRLRRLARSARAGSQPFYSHLLTSVGRRLTSWGQRLQERYGHETTARRPRSAGSQAGS
ncbi:MAG: hypothetical protein M8467_03050 [Anaerolineae bacterium]|nr:hypothetical protein [Anaerolineae bacterium]